jgi:hypothetical protein
MNKIVVEHYPVSRLPEDLREGLLGSGTVRVTLEDTKAVVSPPRGPSRDEFLAQLRDEKRGKGPADGVSREEAVARIRALRDEWGD